jgi:hypothetical protein
VLYLKKNLKRTKKVYTDLQTVEAPLNLQQPFMTSSPNFSSYLLSNEHQSTSSYQPSNKLTIIPDVLVILLISLTYIKIILIVRIILNKIN